MKFELNKKNIIVMIVLILAVIATGTYAWLTYRSNDTAMVLTIGNINSIRVTLSPYQIDATTSPVTAYTSGILTNVTAVNNSSSSKKYNLYYKINNIDNALKISTFKYTITRSTNNGSSYSVYQSGNFVNATSGSDMTIMEETLPTGATYLYKVYVWLDGSGGDQSAASGKSFNAELRGEIVSLPSQYQQVEYIQSSGTQYINSGVPGNNSNLGAKAKYAWVTLPGSSNYAYVIGAYNSENHVSTRILQYGTGTTYFNVNSKAGGGSGSVSLTRTVNTVYTDTLYVENNTQYYRTNNGTLYTKAITSATDSSNPIYVFTASPTSTALASIKLYELIIYDNGERVRHFIPCYDTNNLISGNTYDAGLYDVITNTYYGNAGTGNFTYGAAV